MNTIIAPYNKPPKKSTNSGADSNEVQKTKWDIFKLGVKRAVILVRGGDKHHAEYFIPFLKHPTFTYSILDNYAKAAEGRTPQKKLKILSSAMSHAGEDTDWSKEFGTLVDDILKLASQLKDSDPKLARKALEQLVERIPSVSISDERVNLSDKQLTLAKRTLAEVYENLAEEPYISVKATMKFFALANQYDPAGAAGRIKKLDYMAE